MQKLFALIEKAVSLLQKHENEILSLYTIFTNYWEGKFGGQDPVEYFCDDNEDMRRVICGNPFGHIITIELFHPFLKGFNSSTDENGFLTPIVMPMGILYCDAFPLDYRIDGKSNLDITVLYLSVLKQISHESRFEILSYTRNREAYGNELAEHLGLTNATVSHHTSLLQGTNLLKINPMGTQVLFSSNMETIKNCLDFLKKELL